MKTTPMLLKTPLSLALATMLAASPMAFSGQSTASAPSTSAARTAPVAMILHITVDPRTFDVVIDKDTISRLKSGQILSVGVAGVGHFDYVIDDVGKNADLLEVAGHIVGDVKQKIALGVRNDGITGLIDTPKQTFALGYSNNVQIAGVASSQWMAKELASESSGMTIREVRKGEVPPAPGAEPTNVNLGVLSAMKPGDETVMQLTGLGATRVQLKEIRPGNGSSTWVGHLKDFGEDNTVLMTYSPAATFGHIKTPNGEINLLTNATGELYQFDPIAAGYKHGLGLNGGTDAAHHPEGKTAGAGKGGSVADATATLASTAKTAGAAAAGGNDVDVLVYYTPGMAKAQGSVDKVATRMDFLFAIANEAYARGGLSYRLRRVGLEQINLKDQSYNETILNDLVAKSTTYSNVYSRRDELGADIVMVVRPYYPRYQSGCGYSNISGFDGADVSKDSENAFSVISDGNDQEGSGGYCGTWLLAHELGHIFGLMHDRALLERQIGPGHTGALPYAFGYEVPNRFGTIMSYHYPASLTFSNPNDKKCGNNNNEVCGVPEDNPRSADNNKALSITMPMVAKFRDGNEVAPTYGVTGVITVDGKAASGINMTISSVANSTATADKALVTCKASGGNGVYSCSSPAGYSFTLTPSYSAATVIAWTPDSVDIAELTEDKTANFSGATTSTTTPTPTPTPTPNRSEQQWQELLRQLQEQQERWQQPNRNPNQNPANDWQQWLNQQPWYRPQ